jgi:hypothetical protein
MEFGHIEEQKFEKKQSECQMGPGLPDVSHTKLGKFQNGSKIYQNTPIGQKFLFEVLPKHTKIEIF